MKQSRKSFLLKTLTIKSQSGFSLIETAIAMGVFSAAAAGLFGYFGASQKFKAKQDTISQIQALRSYATTYLDCAKTMAHDSNANTCSGGENFPAISTYSATDSMLSYIDGSTKVGKFQIGAHCNSNYIYFYYMDPASPGTWQSLDSGIPVYCPVANTINVTYTRTSGNNHAAPECLYITDAFNPSPTPIFLGCNVAGGFPGPYTVTVPLTAQRTIRLIDEEFSQGTWYWIRNTNNIGQMQQHMNFVRSDHGHSSNIYGKLDDSNDGNCTPWDDNNFNDLGFTLNFDSQNYSLENAASSCQ